RRIDGAVPLAPTRWDLRRIPRAVPVEVLAEVDGVIARVLEPDGERVRGIELVVAALRQRVPADAVVVRVLARQQARARGTAEREGVEVVVERAPLVTDRPPDVRQDLT